VNETASMSQVIIGPWSRLELLKALLERETKRLQDLIEQHRELRAADLRMSMRSPLSQPSDRA
jgi:hypothetical protein